MTSEDLKCCGNCKHATFEPDICQKDGEETRAFDLCNKWEFDGYIDRISYSLKACQ